MHGSHEVGLGQVSLLTLNGANQVERLNTFQANAKWVPWSAEPSKFFQREVEALGGQVRNAVERAEIAFRKKVKQANVSSVQLLSEKKLLDKGVYPLLEIRGYERCARRGRLRLLDAWLPVQPEKPFGQLRHGVVLFTVRWTTQI